METGRARSRTTVTTTHHIHLLSAHSKLKFFHLAHYTPEAVKMQGIVKKILVWGCQCLVTPVHCLIQLARVEFEEKTRQSKGTSDKVAAKNGLIGRSLPSL